MDEDNLSAEYKDEVLVSILKRRIITLLAAFDDLNLADDNASVEGTEVLHVLLVL